MNDLICGCSQGGDCTRMSVCQAESLIEEMQERIAELESVYQAARRLCFGFDWNNGTHAKTLKVRARLIQAVNAIKPIPDRSELWEILEEQE